MRTASPLGNNVRDAFPSPSTPLQVINWRDADLFVSALSHGNCLRGGPFGRVPAQALRILDRDGYALSCAKQITRDDVRGERADAGKRRIFRGRSDGNSAGVERARRAGRARRALKDCNPSGAHRAQYAMYAPPANAFHRVQTARCHSRTQGISIGRRMNQRVGHRAKGPLAFGE